MLIKKPADIRSSEITPKSLYVNRREFIRAAAVAAGGIGTIAGSASTLFAANPAPHGRKLENLKKSGYSTDERPNPWEQVTTYNNFYEFGVDKEQPAENAHSLKTEPWTVMVEGECNKKGAMSLEDILKGQALEERVYRLRCVEAWSMIIPWVGFSLSEFIKKCEPTGKAKYIEFNTLYAPDQMVGVRMPSLRWPYVEGLRMDEAMHPLTMLVVGLYGEVLPKQNGAPLRLVIPWKYGFKGIKSIVKVKFTDREPINSWKEAIPSEYGFYSNVNPQVDHPRWTQASERRIGEFFRRKTLMFNGYADHVASLYTGMDLKRFY